MSSERTLIFRPNLEHRNRKPWSNDLQDALEASCLLCQEYLQSPDATNFQREYWALGEKHNLSELATSELLHELQKLLPIDGIGTSRENTNKVLNAFTFRSGILACRMMFMVADTTAFKEFESSADVAAWLNKLIGFFAEFSSRSRLNIEVDPLHQRMFRYLLRIGIGFHRLFPLKIPDIEELLEAYLLYVKDLVELCWRSGLTGPLPPLLLALEALIKIPEEPSEEVSQSATLDGLLGPLYPGYMHTLTSDDTGGQASEYRRSEYRLISMDNREMFKKIGEDEISAALSHIDSWGYRRNTKWHTDTYKLILERQYLRKSIDILASEYHLSPRTVQNRVNPIIELLALDQVRADYMTRSEI